MEASWRRFGPSWGRLGGILKASWRRLGGVLAASWRRLGGEDREMARKNKLKAQKNPFYIDSVTSALKKHRKTRGGLEKKLGCLAREPNLRNETTAIGVLSLEAGRGYPTLRGGTSLGPRLAELLACRTHSYLPGGPKTLDTSFIFRILTTSCLILALILPILIHLMPILAQLSSS